MVSNDYMIIKNYVVYKNFNNFLGKGTFSKVYKGQCIGNNKEVAVKIIKTKNIKLKTLKILEDEIKIMNIIQENPHPNIVECYDVIRDNNVIYIIMEYCDSGDLRSILGKPIKEQYTKFYFSQLANGLKYLDNINIIHRDIKPRNILLTHKRRVLKIADFGFAKQGDEISLYDTICGSPLYMAPEIMRQNSYNNQTDLWSIGMILYEMLFGFHPFERCRNITELNTKIKDEVIEVPPKDTKNKEISQECLELLNMLLQKDVKNRVTWYQFFNHNWFDGYKYIIPVRKENNIGDYEKQICSVSVGSLATRDQKEYFLRPNVKFEIIENYIDDQTNNLDIIKNQNKESINCPEGGIFNMELEDDKDIKVKSVVDKSSVLEEIDNKAHQYQIIDQHQEH